VQPLRPRTVRLQVFPGEALDDDQVRAMLDALVARGLLRRYMVAGVGYLAIVDWAIHQRVGRRARRRYPADPASAGHDDASGEGPAASSFPLDHSKPQQRPASDLRAPPPSGAPPVPDLRGEAQDDAAAADEAAWQRAVEAAVRRAWGADLPEDGRAPCPEVARRRPRPRARPGAGDRPRCGRRRRWSPAVRLQDVDAVLSLTSTAFVPVSAPSAVVAPTP